MTSGGRARFHLALAGLEQFVPSHARKTEARCIGESILVAKINLNLMSSKSFLQKITIYTII
jgi:hypothetical protein